MEFAVNYRNSKGKGFNKQLRIKGENSGIVYGIGEPIMVSMASEQLISLLRKTQGKTQLIELSIYDENKIKEQKRVIIQDYQLSNISETILHVDFREVDENTILRIETPIKTVGTAKVTKLGGVMQIIRNKIPITCAMKNIPEFIEINVESLDFGGSIHVLDIPYPEGVKPIATGRNFTLITAAGTSSAEPTAETEQDTEEIEQT